MGLGIPGGKIGRFGRIPKSIFSGAYRVTYSTDSIGGMSSNVYPVASDDFDNLTNIGIRVKSEANVEVKLTLIAKMGIVSAGFNPQLSQKYTPPGGSSTDLGSLSVPEESCDNPVTLQNSIIFSGDIGFGRLNFKNEYTLDSGTTQACNPIKHIFTAEAIIIVDESDILQIGKGPGVHNRKIVKMA